MNDLVVRPMTPRDLDRFRSDLAGSYAAEHVDAGEWHPDEAAARARDEIDALLPEGLGTRGMPLLTAASTGGEVLGPEGGSAWIYDVEVDPPQRGKGYGPALMLVVEEEAARRGIEASGLNVFGANAAARSLYESLGYETTSLQMRKRLTGGPD